MNETLRHRILPQLTDQNRAFWTGGANGELLILRDVETGRWVHPPDAVDREEFARLTPMPVAGTGTVFTFTVNQHRFHPDVDPPYVIAVVELDEQNDLRLACNITGCEPDEVSIGLRVVVTFERHEQIFVPLFTPVRS